MISILLAAFPALAQPLLLTDANQIRALTLEEASRHIPVRLSGVAIDDANGSDAIVLWSTNTGIYVQGTKELVAEVKRGDLIEVDGHSDPGGFAPIVQAEKIRRLGDGKIPDPIPVAYEQLLDGRMDAQWVEITGVVRSCEPMAGQKWKARMTLETGGKRLLVQVDNHLPSRAYMGAEVRLRGICFFRYNSQRQALGPSLLVPRGVAVLVNKPGSVDIYTTPVITVSNLMRFSTKNSYLQRVHVQGIVTYSQLGQFLWLRQGDRGLFVQSDQAEPVEIGDKVDVVGFPGYGAYTPILEDAVFRKGDLQPPPAPVKLTEMDSVWQHDADLVECEAVLQEVRSTPDGWVILLNWNGVSVRAIFRWPKHLPHPDDWLAGSRVRVAGICSVVTEPTGPVTGLWQPQTFQLLMRSPTDLNILEPPPLWTPKRVIYALTAITISALLALGGITLVARRRAKQQDLERERAEAEFAAVLTERNRIAREIHDTLAQGLGAISLQLELAKDKLRSGSDSAARHVELAQQSARQSLADARNSIWNMRSQVLENGNLADALEAILKQQAAWSEIQANLQVIGRIHRLPAMVENNLLRIGQEAIVNAVKHAQATRIEVKIEFAERQTSLMVRDNGVGFDPAASAAGAGGFGLTCMRQRTAEMQGELQIQSESGSGSVIKLKVPDFSGKKSSNP